MTKQPTSPCREMRALADLVPHPLQLRYFDDLSQDDLQRLADDIRRNGLRQRIQVLPANKAGLPTNTVVKGHQRRRALLLLGKTRAEVLVRYDLADADIATIEREFLEDNMNRRQLDPLAKARVAIRLFEIEKGKDRRRLNEGDLRDRVAKILGMSGRHLQRYLNVLLRTPVEIQDALRRKRISLVAADSVSQLGEDAKAKIVHQIRAGGAPREVVAHFLEGPGQQRSDVCQTLTSFVRAVSSRLKRLEPRLDEVTYSQAERILPLLEQAAEVIRQVIARAHDPAARERETRFFRAASARLQAGEEPDE